MILMFSLSLSSCTGCSFSLQVFHGQTPSELKVMIQEMNRILRPGGYLWLRGGWSLLQFDFLREFLVGTLGYVALHSDEQRKPEAVTAKIFFGPDRTLPYAIDWTTIYVKPIAKAITADCAPVPAAAKQA